MMRKKPKSSPNSYDVGYRRPPKKFQFKQGSDWEAQEAIEYARPQSAAGKRTQ
jgi:hypothetical protein